MRATMLMLAVFLASCGGDPGADRLAEEPWRAWVTMTEAGVRVRLEYEPEDGGPRERMLEDGGRLPWPAGLDSPPTNSQEPLPGGILSRVATVLELPLDRSWNRTLRRLPSDGASRMSRLFLAVPTDGEPPARIPFLVPNHYAEREIARLGIAFQPQDIAMRLTTESVIEVRITRQGGRVRYRWEQSRINRREPTGPGGDLTLTDAQIRAPARGPLLPGLAGVLEARTEFESGVRAAVVFLFTTDEVLCIDALRAVECARGDPTVMFLPYPAPWGWNDDLEFRSSIRVPRVSRELEPETWTIGRRWHRQSPLRLSLDAPGDPGWEFYRVTPEEAEEALARFAPDARHRVKRHQIIILRFDGRCPWSQARPWMQHVEEGEIEMRLRFMNGEYGINSECELHLPPRARPPDLDLPLAEAPTRLGDVRGRVVRLTSPDTATVNDVWQAALAIMDAGAAGIDFE